ncbi:CHAT domain-containing protein [Micromonospora sp. DT233]|uniref:CHAT domain-containing protein n=1 Tax=Micromonospora sp. DT233 TaxID=3393432 RepID=UPI003CEFEDB4
MTGFELSSPHADHDGGRRPERLFDELRAARDELRAAIGEIQQIPGYEQFLASVEIGDVTAAAEHPLVYVTPADEAGLALVVRGEEIVDVALPGLRAAHLHEWAERHREHFPRVGEPASRRVAWDRHLAALCDWLWEVVAGPLLPELAGEARVSVVPCGLVGLLPLHAARCADATRPTGFRHLVDEVAVGYVPNARALAASRRRAAAEPAGGLLVVTDPEDPDPRQRLPYSRWEGETAAAGFAGPVTPLSGPDATARRVRAELPAAWEVHFGCHASADQRDPLQSALRLAGADRLRLADLLPLRLRMRLAVLSACETFLPGLDLPDEVISLPAGLIQAGVAGVLASMWPVDDHATALFMTEFYRRWRADDRRSPADALAGTQRWLRDATPGEVEQRWAAALDAGEPWLPAEVAGALLPQLFRSGSADSRPWSAPAVWAAFAFTGA